MYVKLNGKNEHIGMTAVGIGGGWERKCVLVNGSVLTQT